MALGHMKTRSSLVVGIAIILGLPATIIYIAALPVQLIGLFVTVKSPSIDGLWLVLPLVCGGYSIGWYWFLIERTAKRRKVSMGPSFMLGVGCAVVSAAFFSLLSWPSLSPVLIVLAPFAGAFNLYHAQQTMFHDMPPNIAANRDAPQAARPSP